MNMVGETVKQIRLSKNYKQSEVSKNIMHQTSYSKFELENIEISYQKFHKILDNLEMDLEEFKFVHYGYDYSPRDKIIRNFFQIKFIDIRSLNEIISASKVYLMENDDRYIEDILSISRGLINIEESGNFESARSYAEKVWKRLEKLDTWYLSDFKLIGVILFLFPIETAVSITNYALKQSEKYENYIDYKKIFIPFKYNLVQLLIRKKLLIQANSLNEDVLTDLKEQKAYPQIALCYIRKGLLENLLNKSNGDKAINKAFDIAEVMEDENLKVQLEQERSYLENVLEID
ncbi:Rgg/GadR/MutR family transcriptional regulator [Jeotgalibacillus aurantiacus]|uniref:Rgg/GadR/MutR family transcriptional regulator n=1 Tax=Jeotgalibacillus aurantiacus TaxID=2763266 RepID=UPI001D0A8995|nr:Rgg/GadR/MutR family transcriptional regulator [Jeotgalibacillus aurantiacus]